MTFGLVLLHSRLYLTLFYAIRCWHLPRYSGQACQQPNQQDSAHATAKRCQIWLRLSADNRAVTTPHLSPHCPALYAINVGCMCSGAVKPSRFKIVGPTLASPGSLTLVLNFVPSGKPGPPMMTGTCMHGTQVSISKTQSEMHH